MKGYPGWEQDFFDNEPLEEPPFFVAADLLAEAAEKASNALGALIDHCDVSTRGAARAALRELDAALEEYREADDA
jgi:hypothetical protein